MTIQTRVHRMCWGLLAIATLVVLWARPAQAQGIAESFRELRLLVRSGDTVTVVDRQGQATRGRLVQLTDTHLTFEVHGATLALNESEVGTVLQKYGDPLSNGAINGFLTGAAVAGAAVIAAANFGGSGAELAGLTGLLVGFYGGVGAGIGVGIDAMRSSDRVVFNGTTSPAARLQIAPVWTPRRTGAVVSFSF